MHGPFPEGHTVDLIDEIRQEMNLRVDVQVHIHVDSLKDFFGIKRKMDGDWHMDVYDDFIVASLDTDGNNFVRVYMPEQGQD